MGPPTCKRDLAWHNTSAVWSFWDLHIQLGPGQDQNNPDSSLSTTKPKSASYPRKPTKSLKSWQKALISLPDNCTSLKTTSNPTLRRTAGLLRSSEKHLDISPANSRGQATTRLGQRREAAASTAGLHGVMSMVFLVFSFFKTED